MDMISCPDSGRRLFSIHQPWLISSSCIGACLVFGREKGGLTKAIRLSFAGHLADSSIN